MLMISEISETWVPPQGQPGLSPNFTIRGVLPCNISQIGYKLFSFFFLGGGGTKTKRQKKKSSCSETNA